MNKNVILRRPVYVLLVILLSFLGTYKGDCQSQNPTFDQNPIPPSPEAEAFAKYGSYPVDYSTGVPKIKIPVYEIKSGNLSLPISLTYHASGIKVGALAGSSGLGWSLNAGGMISRVINGLEDERSFLGYTHYSAANLDSYQPPQDFTVPYEYVKGIAFGGYDGRSDDYSYSVGSSLSGQFVYDINKNIQQRSFTNNIITRTAQNTFEILGEDGTHYIFNDVESVHSAISGYCPSSWLVSKIISSNLKDTISFEYNNFPGYSYFTESQTFNNNNRIEGDLSTYNTFEWHRNILDYYNSMLVKRIKFRNGSVTFTYEGGRKDLMANRLSAITINSINNADVEMPLSSYVLVHSYFGDINDPNAKFVSRLRLDEIKRVDKDNQYINSYHFHYNSMVLPALIDPNHPSGPTVSSAGFAQDYWGYYNGHLENRHLMPDIPSQAGTPANRSSDEVYMKAESLEKIDYPTGGSTSFEFEANRNNLSALVGGLRVKTITSTSNATATPIIKQYQYNNPVLLTPNTEPSYYSFFQKYDNGVSANWGAFDCPTKIVYFSEPIVPSGSHNGSPVVYTSVTELMDNGANQKQKTVYAYDSESDQSYSVPATGKYGSVAYSNKSWARGNLLSTSYYKFINGNYTVNKVITNQYDAKKVSTVNTGLNCFIQTVHSQNDMGRNLPGGVPLPYGYPYGSPCSHPRYYDFDYFDVYEEAGVKKVISTEEIDYDDNGNPTTDQLTNTAYESTEHLFPTKKTQVNSDGNQWITMLKYPFDFRWQAPYDEMISKNIVSPTVKVLNYKNSTAQFISSQTTNYFNWGNNIIEPATVQVQTGSYPMETSLHINYDAQANPVQLQKFNGPYTSYQWGYRQQYPVAEVKNARNDFSSTSVVANTSASYSNEKGDNVFVVNTDPQTTLFTVGQNNGSVTITEYENDFSFTGRVEITATLTGPNTYSKSFTLQVSSTPQSGPGSSITITGLAAGNYTLTSSAGFYTTANTPANASISISYPTGTNNTGANEFFFESFEEGNGNNADAKTGHYSYNGSYQKALNDLSAGNYMLTYWQKSGSVWSLVSTPVTITGSTYTIGASPAINAQIDDVRFYPATAQMTTYTYDPLVGMTSATDTKNQTVYYGYDGLQRLINIKDKDGNIVKNYQYNYAGQQTVVTPPVTPTIYARIEYSNYTYPSTYTDADNYSNSINADVSIKLYSDAGCTTPFTLTASMNVNVTSDSQITYGTGGGTSSSGVNSYTLQPGATGQFLGNKTLENHNTYTDPRSGTGNITDNEFLAFSVTSNGSFYTPAATLN